MLRLHTFFSVALHLFCSLIRVAFGYLRHQSAFSLREVRVRNVVNVQRGNQEPFQSAARNNSKPIKFIRQLRSGAGH